MICKMNNIAEVRFLFLVYTVGQGAKLYRTLGGTRREGLLTDVFGV